MNCRAPGRGGAVYFDNGAISRCEFLGNTANEGGAVANNNNNADCLTEIQGNTFAWNDATLKGGAMAFTSVFQAMISGNSFYRNTALTGGGVAFTTSISKDDGSGSVVTPTVNTPPRNCLDYSPASYYYLSNSMLMGNVFTENSAWPTAGSTSATANARGAAVALLDSTLWLEGETYENNYSAGNGGALHQTTGVSQVHRSKFLGNQASADGGAFSLTMGSPLLNNCAFVRNEAGAKGGVLRSAAGSTFTLIQSTLTRNKSVTGAAACQADGSLIIHNSLVWNNLPRANSLVGVASLQIFGTNSQPGSFTLPSTTPPSGNTSVEPALAYDQYHLTGQPVATLGLGRLEVAQLPQNQFTNPWLKDLEREARLYNTANPPEAGCDEFVDTDGDGLPDWFEQQIIARSPGNNFTTATLNGATPLWGQGYTAMDLLTLQADSDGDGLPDGWEINNGLNPDLADAGQDPDRDGFTNLEEYQGGSSPQNDEDAPANVKEPKLLCRQARHTISLPGERASYVVWPDYLLPAYYNSDLDGVVQYFSATPDFPGTPDFSKMKPDFSAAGGSTEWRNYDALNNTAQGRIWFRPADMAGAATLVHQQVSLRAPARPVAWQQPYLITITGSRKLLQTVAGAPDGTILDYPVGYQSGVFEFAPKKSLCTNPVLLRPQFTLTPAQFPLLSSPNPRALGGIVAAPMR